MPRGTHARGNVRANVRVNAVALDFAEEMYYLVHRKEKVMRKILLVVVLLMFAACKKDETAPVQLNLGGSNVNLLGKWDETFVGDTSHLHLRINSDTYGIIAGVCTLVTFPMNIVGTHNDTSASFGFSFAFDSTAQTVFVFNGKINSSTWLHGIFSVDTLNVVSDVRKE